MTKFEQNLFTSLKGGEDQRFDDVEVDNANKYYVNAKINSKDEQIQGKIFTIENKHTRYWFYVFVPSNQSSGFEDGGLPHKALDVWTIEEAEEWYIITSVNELCTDIHHD